MAALSRWYASFAGVLHASRQYCEAQELLLSAVSSFESENMHRDTNKVGCTFNLARHYSVHSVPIGEG